MDPNDLVTKRDHTRSAPRDNVLYELGIFHGARGKEHAFFVFRGDKPPDLPTDLAGLTAAIYYSEGQEDLTAALEPVARKIKIAIERAIPISPLRGCEEGIRQMIRLMISRISRALPGSHPDDIGGHVWWLDTRRPEDEVRLTRVLREHAGGATRYDWAPWRRGHGVVGRAWERNETVHLDMNTPEVVAIENEHDLAHLPADLRAMIDFKSLYAIRRFRGIWAHPIQRADGTLLGVVRTQYR